MNILIIFLKHEISNTFMRLHQFINKIHIDMVIIFSNVYTVLYYTIYKLHIRYFFCRMGHFAVAVSPSRHLDPLFCTNQHIILVLIKHIQFLSEWNCTKITRYVAPAAIACITKVKRIHVKLN